MNKMKVVDFEDFDEIQKMNIDGIIKYAIADKKWSINLDDIPENKKVKDIDTYCGKNVSIKEHSMEYKGKVYWDLNNL